MVPLCSQTDWVVSMRRDSHILDSLRDLSTQTDRGKIRDQMYTDASVHFYWRLVQNRRHKVIKMKSERKYKREGGRGRRERGQ